MNKNIKNDFPIFKAQSREKPFVFLDSAAVAHMPQVAIDAVTEYYQTYKANTHSGMYHIGARSIEAYENARSLTARFIGAKPAEIIFTSGTTASLNMLARMLEPQIQQDDEIILSALEHHSNFIPWQELAKRTGASFVVLPLEPNGALSPETVKNAVSERTKIVAVTHVSHAIGAVNNVSELCRIAHKAGALCVVDAAQSVPHMPVNVRAIDCDYLAFSGQKVMGPTGIGVLYGKKALLEKLEPVVYGGGMIRDVSATQSIWADTPYKFEAGTAHVAGAIGLACSISYIEHIGKTAIYEHEQNLVSEAVRALENMPNVVVYRPPVQAGIVSFNVQGAHPHDVAEILARDNIAVRAGHHCALPLMKHLGVSGTVRASFFAYNTAEDIERLVAGVTRACAILL